MRRCFKEDALPLRDDQPKTQDTKTMMLSGLVHRLRTCFTLLHRRPEPHEEAPAATAPQGKDTFVRHGTTRPRKSIDTSTPQLPGHDAPTRPYLAHSGCSCVLAQVATMPEPWQVMGRRWKTAKFVQAHNELAARRGAPRATINPPRIRSTAHALQEYRRTQLLPPAPCACCSAPPRDAALHATVRSDSPHLLRHGATRKLLPFPSPMNVKETYSSRAPWHLLGASYAEQEAA